MKFRTRRKPTNFRATLSSDWGERRIDIIDVTEEGARVRLAVGNLEPETRVEMHVRGKGFPATVIWNREGEAGLAFDKMLPLDILGAINHRMRRQNMGKKKRFLMD